MTNKNKLTITLLSSLLIISCQTKVKEKDLALNTSIIQEHSIYEENPYLVEFDKLSPSYILSKANEVEDFYIKNIKKSGYTGSFLVAKNGQIIYEDYSGFANKRNAEQITENTPIHVASVGKVVTAVTIMRLIDMGKLELDQSVSEIIEGFPYPEITVKTLLSHRSGLRYYGYYGEVWSYKTPIKNQDVIDIIKSEKVDLDFSPNTRFSYSNTNYVVLASIVEKVTNKTFREAVRELIFDPLEMKNSFVFDDLDKKNDVTQSYKSNYTPMHWDYMDSTYGDKNIYVTPRDFLKLDTALYSETFLSEKLRKQMFQGYSFENKGVRNYGLGFRLIEMTNGDTFTYHNGWWRGNTSSYIRLEKDNVCIILFSNKYSKLTYKTVDLSHHFGDYPVGNLEL
ncbi:MULTISPECIES: serine hydrolase domain-containing protein [Myroides]|uniref:Serine hydrolase n=1 Tax=Myroides albus TaxID=2562892 RepID=A0A6I3LJR7_9FLAO|nr:MULTISPECIES: serine hydrolase domain-containing protein [Myroides]MTG98513.1 serine hydrolase [Myroides albus]MVX34944.1 serine hydrolase [Myroides sp. LoEW2-1]UVD79535.1 beta-lactamase family protein [Myroides albus]